LQETNLRHTALGVCETVPIAGLNVTYGLLVDIAHFWTTKRIWTTQLNMWLTDRTMMVGEKPGAYAINYGVV